MPDRTLGAPPFVVHAPSSPAPRIEPRVAAPPAAEPPSLTVRNADGATSTFSVDRFAGTMVRLGAPPAHALTVANALEGALHARYGFLGDAIPTAALSSIAVNAVGMDVSQHGVDALLTRYVPTPVALAPADEHTPTAAAPPPAVALRGPAQYGAMPLRQLYNSIAVLDPAFAACGLALVDLAANACDAVVRAQLPSFVAAIADIPELVGGDPDRLLRRLLGDIPPGDVTQAAAAATDAYERLVAKNPFNPDDPIDEAWQKRFMTYLEQALGRAAHRDSLKTPEGMDFVMVATTERKNLLFNPRSTAEQSGYPLYCYVATDESATTNTGADEPQAVEVTYVGDIIAALITADDTVPSAFDVATGWLTDLDNDWRDDRSKEKGKRYWDGVPLGQRVHFYNWFLIEPDNITSNKLFKQGLEKLSETLDAQKKDLADKAKKMIDDALKGTNFPGAGVAGQLGGELVKLLVPWLIDILADNKFPTATIMHVTMRPAAEYAPFSAVSLIVNKAIQAQSAPVVDPVTGVKEIVPKPTFVHEEAYYCAWFGASIPAPHTPWGLKEAVARGPKGNATQWRDPAHGFGVFLQQNEPNSAFWTKEGVYVACLRADVRLVSTDDTTYFPG